MPRLVLLRSGRNAKSAQELFQQRNSLLQMLRDAYRGRYKMSLLTTVALVLGLIYIISPLDFDWLPIIGWVDDGFILYLLLQRLAKETQRYNRQKAMGRKLEYRGQI